MHVNIIANTSETILRDLMHTQVRHASSNVCKVATYSCVAGKRRPPFSTTLFFMSRFNPRPAGAPRFLRRAGGGERREHPNSAPRLAKDTRQAALESSSKIIMK